MKNKTKLKRCIIISSISTLIFISIFIFITIYEYHIYNKNYNYKLLSIINKIEEKYPDITEKEIIEILSSNKSTDILNKYSIDLDNDIIIKENKYLYIKFIIINIIFYLITILFICIYFLRFNYKKDKEINKITKYIEEINKKNYKLDLDDISEDELSILKNEIYKTTINLRQLAEISTNDKLELKKSLSDISHQIKTPLTSINIILDNLIDDPDMDKKIREEFIKDIKREVNNINFLVLSILKLSKLDTNTINFIRKYNSVKNIINKSLQNVSMLSDLKDIKFNIEYFSNPIIYCDLKWEIEAISNILKNSIEHSNNNSIINIEVNDNKVYSSINIINRGDTIDKDDLPHIFDRFYKGKNSLSESTGIGLSLSKSIIEKDNGKISVNSSDNITKFIIKYFK